MTHVAQLVGQHPTKRKVAGSLPGQGTCLGSFPSGENERQLIDVSLLH